MDKGREYSRLEIEAMVISDALTAPETIPDTRASVTGEMFTVTALNAMWSRIVAAWDAGAPLSVSDILSIGDRTARAAVSGCLGESGGTLGTLAHARALVSAHANGMALDFAARVSRRIEAGMVTPEELAVEARGLVAALESCHKQRRTVTVSEAVGALGERLEATRLARESGDSPYISTGFQLLDLHFRGGVRGGNVMVMAARPGVGKTATLLSMVRAALSEGRAVRLYSLEMPAVEIAERLMFALGGLRPYMARTGEVDKPAWDAAAARLAGWPLWIEDNLNTIGEILSDALMARQRGECDIVFIDHLRLVRTGDKRTDADIYARTCEITAAIKRFALSSMLPVVYACQLNRNMAREGRDPDLQDLRDSGSIEEDADQIVFLKRETGAGGDARLKMIVGKNRHGGGAYEKVWLIPNETFSVFSESATPDGEARPDPATSALDDMPDIWYHK